jgi:hypothetical protein
MSPRPFITAALLFASCVISSVLAAEELGTFPAVPESGKAFQVLHHKDVAAAKLAAEEKLPPAEVKYKWMVKVTDGKNVFRPSVSGVPVKLPDGPNLKVTKAKPGATYTFILERTDSTETRLYRLVVEFGPEGAEAAFSDAEVPPSPSVEPPPAPGADKPAPGSDKTAPGAEAADKAAADKAAAAGAQAQETPAVTPAGSAQQFTYTIQEFDGTNESLDKLNAKIRLFLSNPNNQVKGPVTPEFFKARVTKRYQISPNKSQSVQGAQLNSPLVAAALLASKMHEVEKSVKDDALLLGKWNAEEEQLYKDMTQGDAPILVDELVIVWRLFLAEWLGEAVNKGSLREGLKQAPYELLNAFVNIGDLQQKAVQGGQAGPNAGNQQSTTGSSVSGGYFPHHERLMNHIYHHHYHQMNKVERIRARR